MSLVLLAIESFLSDNRNFSFLGGTLLSDFRNGHVIQDVDLLHLVKRQLI